MRDHDFTCSAYRLRPDADRPVRLYFNSATDLPLTDAAVEPRLRLELWAGVVVDGAQRDAKHKSVLPSFKAKYTSAAR